jgi:neuron navigator 1
MESHSCSADTLIGLAPFMSCPVDDVAGSRNWFIKLWNESILPHMKEAIREGLQLHGQR